MLPTNLKDILGDSYNENFFKNGNKFSEILESEGILIFNSFISKNGLSILQKEASDLKDLSAILTPKNHVYEYFLKFFSKSL